MKNLITFIILSCLATAAKAQGGSAANASQSAKFVLSDVIEIVFSDVDDVTGTTVFLPFNNARDFKNGVTFNDQQLRVRSNSGFKVSLKYDMNTFNYIGSEKADVSVLNEALGVMVTSNNTGGQVAAPFSTDDYAPIAGIDKDLVINGTSGGNQNFAVKYKCTPKQHMPIGNYFINVVYTATKN